MMMKPTRIIALGIFATGVCSAIMVLTLTFSRKPQLPIPEAVAPAEVRVKAVDRKTEMVEPVDAAAASAAVAIVCGADAETAGRYEARNDALRSIAR